MADKLTYEKVLAMFAETDRRLDKRFADTDKRFKEISGYIGGITKSNGAFAEELFINTLTKKPTIGGVAFKEIKHNFQINVGLKTLTELDVLLYAPGKVLIIEIKYRVRKEDVEKLMDEKLNAFLTAFPQYKEKAVYLGIAGLSFENPAKNLANQNKIALIKLKGDTFVEESKEMKSFTKPEPSKTLGKPTKKAPAKKK